MGSITGYLSEGQEAGDQPDVGFNPRQITKWERQRELVCRMLGMAARPQTGSDEKLPVWREMVGSKHSLRWQSENGKIWPGDSPGHADSWGLGWFDADGKVSLVRQTGAAHDSAYWVFSSETAARGGGGSGPARVVIGHLRKASCGVVSSENAHPIRVDFAAPNASGPYDTILVAHNGTLYPPLLELLRADLQEANREEAIADSDTVVLAGWLGARLAQTVGPATGLFEALRAALRELFMRADAIAPDNDLTKAYSGVNLVIGHADGLFALRQFSRRGAYYTLFAKKCAPDTSGENPEAGCWVVASEPTDGADPFDTAAASDKGWELLEPGVLFWYPPRAGDGGVQSVRVAEPLTPEAAERVGH